MLLTVVYKKTKDATVALCKASIKVGFATSVITGFIEVSKNTKVGDTMDIKTAVNRTSISKDGKTFDWLVIS